MKTVGCTDALKSAFSGQVRSNPSFVLRGFIPACQHNTRKGCCALQNTTGARHILSTSSSMSLPSGPLDGLLCAFSSSSSHFALATSDGRVKTYDTGERQQEQHWCAGSSSSSSRWCCWCCCCCYGGRQTATSRNTPISRAALIQAVGVKALPAT